MLYSGNERIHVNRQELPYTLLDFWRSNLSQLLLNLTRGSFATFLVQCALTDNGIDAIHQEKAGNEPWDIDGPDLYTSQGKRPSRIEVKSTASIQINTPDEKEPLSLPDTKLTFSIRKAIDWDRPELGENRNNDLYVFCHYKAGRKKDDILDLCNWDFYVYPTYKIEQDSSLKEQKSISVYRLKALKVQPQSYETLYDEIIRVINEISNHDNNMI